MKTYSILLIALALSSSAHAQTGTPDYVGIKLFAAQASTSDDCTNPVTIFNDCGTDANGNPDCTTAQIAAATRQDMTQSPTLGTGTLANGTYNCLILWMSDQIVYRYSTAVGTCTTTDTDQTMEVCNSNGSGDGVYAKPGESTGTTCVYGTEEAVPLYLTTKSVNDGTQQLSGNSFVGPLDNASTGADITTANTANGFTVNALTISAAATKAFVTDFTNKLDGSGGSCDVQPPLFAFE